MRHCPLVLQRLVMVRPGLFLKDVAKFASRAEQAEQRAEAPLICATSLTAWPLKRFLSLDLSQHGGIYLNEQAFSLVSLSFSRGAGGCPNPFCPKQMVSPSPSNLSTSNSSSISNIFKTRKSSISDDIT